MGRTKITVEFGRMQKTCGREKKRVVGFLCLLWFSFDVVIRRLPTIHIQISRPHELTFKAGAADRRYRTGGPRLIPRGLVL